MGAVYAAVSDVQTLGRTLTAEEQERAEQLLPAASALLRREAKKRGYDLDSMIADDEDVGLIAKNVTVSAVVRALDVSASSSESASAAVSQGSQSGLGYSVSYTYVNAGQSLYILRNELKELGIMRQRYGVLEVYDLDNDTGD